MAGLLFSRACTKVAETESWIQISQAVRNVNTYVHHTTHVRNVMEPSLHIISFIIA